MVYCTRKIPKNLLISNCAKSVGVFIRQEGLYFFHEAVLHHPFHTGIYSVVEGCTVSLDAYDGDRERKPTFGSGVE